MIHEITTIIEQWGTHPMTYSGKLSFLNALIDIGTADRVKFERLIRVIGARRKEIPEIKRVDYQRDFMAEKRARLDKAAALQELLKGRFPDTKARRAYTKAVQSKWMIARDAYIAGLGELPWTARQAARGVFWESIDQNLDTALAVGHGQR